MALQRPGGGSQTPSSNGFQWTPIKEDTGIVIFTIAGQKGCGKTTLALSNEGTYLVFDFDGKTRRVWANIFNKDPRFTLFDGKNQIPKDMAEEKLPDAGKRQHEEIMWILREAKAKGGFDWIVMDGFEHLEKISEWRMRSEEKIGAFQNFANRSLWKKRKLYIQQVHELAKSVARKGLIYVTFTRIEEVTDEIGSSSISREVPRWIDIVLEETDTLIQPFVTYDQKTSTLSRFVLIPTDKLYKWGTGRCYSVENLEDAVNFWNGSLKSIKDRNPVDLHKMKMDKEKLKVQEERKTYDTKKASPF